jgi:hypothetical protein
MAERLDRIWGKSAHHYTDLGTAEKLIQARNLWLTDARYCDDRAEMLHAAQIIKDAFAEIQRVGMLVSATPSVLSHSDQSFLDNLLSQYATVAPTLTALVCCFCEGDEPPSGSSLHRGVQDILSQWRGYGANGRGACVSFATRPLQDVAHRTKGMLFEPVLYDAGPQKQLTETVVGSALDAHRAGTTSALQDGCDALAVISPLFKHPGFAEEKEWRLVFMPQFGAAPIPMSFRARQDVLVPYSDANTILGGGNPFILTEVMVGPSNLQDLNESALGRVPGAPTISRSIIPYRV